MAVKLQNLEFPLIVLGFWVDFNSSPFFLWSMGKKSKKKCLMCWKWCHLIGKYDFWAKIGSRAKIDVNVNVNVFALSKSTQNDLLKDSIGNG